MEKKPVFFANIVRYAAILFTLLLISCSHAFAETEPMSGDQKTILDLSVAKLMEKVESLEGKSKFEVKAPTVISDVRSSSFEMRLRKR